MGPTKSARAGMANVLALLAAACGGATNTTPAGATEPASEAVAEAAPPAAAVDLPGFRQPRAGLWTGGRPSREVLEAAAHQGVRVVISLLPPADMGDEAAQVSELHMELVSIPIAGEADLTEDNARKLGEVFVAHQGQTMLLHCGSGNRAGALLALEAFYVEGMSGAEAIHLGVSAGLASLQTAVRAHLDAACAATPERC